MLSNSDPSVPQRQRFHRRQNSTPLAIDSSRVYSVPPSATGLTRHNSHRRGQSLDQQRSPIRRRPSPSQDPIRTFHTNLGQPGFQQHILQEAQQQRLARPGQQQRSQQSQQYQQLTLQQNPQCGPIEEQAFPFDNNQRHGLYIDTLGLMPQISENQHFGSAQELTPSHSFDMPTGTGCFEGYTGVFENISPSESQVFQPTNMMIQTQEKQLAGHARQMSQHSDMSVNYQRPTTPTKQMNSAPLPLTPVTTPFETAGLTSGVRTADSSPVKRYLDDSLNPMLSTGMQRGRSLQGIYELTTADIPSPPKTAPLTSSEFDFRTRPTSELANETSRLTVDTAYFSSPLRSPVNPISPNISPFNSPPRVNGMAMFEGNQGEAMTSQTSLSSARKQTMLSAGASPIKGPSSPKGSMSISDLNLTPEVDATKVDTGVSMDDIEMYMEGPDPSDNKFRCTYPECGKRFGRRENIKSHIQTHLNDRQYQCLKCGSKFVRGHDLKRHAKTHDGRKPFVCLCGNGFGRPDALTRHRQRNMCIGAIDGIVKKEARRGRPPKYANAQEARKEKIRRTKERNRANAAANNIASVATFPSSVSISSDSEYHSASPPPSTLMDNLSILDPASPGHDLDVVIRGSSPLDTDPLFGRGADAASFPPDVFTFTPPTSPGYSTGNKPSPLRSHSNSVVGDMADMGLQRPNARLERIREDQQEASQDSSDSQDAGSHIDQSVLNSGMHMLDRSDPPAVSPAIPSSSPPGLEASSPMTDEEMDRFLVNMETFPNEELYSDEFFNSHGDFTL